MAKESILVIRGGAIGDFVLTLPVLAALRAHFPEHRLEVLGNPRIARLAQYGGCADEIHDLEDRRLTSLFIHPPDASVVRGGWVSSASIIVSYLHDPEIVFESNWLRGSNVRWIRGPHRPSDALGIHATQQLLQPLETLGIFQANPLPQLNVGLERGSSHAKDLAKWCGDNEALAVHPGSGSFQKNWSESSWRELLSRWLDRTDRGLLIVGGEAEGDRLSRFASTLPASRCRRAESLPLWELASVLSNCRQLVGHDSGISHLAAAVGLPVLVLWGPTSFDVWRPLGNAVEVIQHPNGLPGIEVSMVEPRLR